MKYITNTSLRDKDIMFFINRILNKEREKYFNKYDTIDFSKYVKIRRENDKIVVDINYNVGLCCYNVITLTDFTFDSLYPMCIPKKEHQFEWQCILTGIFPGYAKEMKQFIINERKQELAMIKDTDGRQ